ncbi:AAA family ATPase [candidate division WWE3 bacterium]|nr:AAA family ATPase [candidate division WWE3 bacterium]
MENLTNTIHACIAANVPAVALSTTETDTVIQEIAEYAAMHTHKLKGQQKRRRILVWRESVGFEEYGVFTKADGVKTLVEILDSSVTNTTVERIEDPSRRRDDGKKSYITYQPEEMMPMATIPFALDFIEDYNANTEGRGAIFVLRDWHRYIDLEGSGMAAHHVDRQLQIFETFIRGGEKTVVMLSPNRWDAESIPIELNQHIYNMRYPMPEKAERMVRVTGFVNRLKAGGEFPVVNSMAEDEVESVVDAAAGLTRTQMNNVLCMALVNCKSLDVDYILNEKRKLVEQAGFIMTRPKTGFELIGGLNPLKEWALRLRKRFTKAARDYGFTRFPSGLLMAGVPGCGKSQISKALANEWNMNLLTVQATDLKGSLVGESEAKVHRLLDTAKAAAPIIVFVDEAEKLLGNSEGIHDGGAHDAVLSQFLSFMQDDDSGVFFVFTANNMEKFAPELIDRFEGRFFIDLPTAGERKEILKIHLTRLNQGAERFDLDELVRESKDFSGRNIEHSIEEAMGIAFDQDRAMNEDDLLKTFKTVIPTSKTEKNKIETMRSYVDNGLMRQANYLPELDYDEEENAGARDFL